MRTRIEQTGEHGVIHDVEPRLLPPNAWSGGTNVSTYAGSIASVKGYKTTIKTPDARPYWLQPWLVGGAQQWIYAGYDGTKMVLKRITDTTTEVDVSRTATAYTAARTDRWSGGILGGLPVCTNGVDEPQVWDTGTSKFIDMSGITGWDAGDTCRVLVPHRSFLIAADITESGTRYRKLIRWSHRSDPGTLPNSFDETDDTKLSGRTELSQTDDPIVDLVRLGEDLLVYCTNSVWRMTFLEHSLYVFDLAPVFDTFGAAALNCVMDTGDGRHIVYTGTDLVIHDGREKKSLLSQRSQRRLPRVTDVTAKTRAFMTTDRVRNEAWFCYPAQGQPPPAFATETWPMKAFVVNWETGDTGWRDIPGASAAAIGDLEDYEPDETWDDSPDLWNSKIQLWDDVPRQGRANLVLCGTENSEFYGMGLSTDIDGEEFVATLVRQDLALPEKDPDEIITVTNVFPKVKVAGDYTIDMYVGGASTEEGSITWKGPYRFDPAAGYKEDLFVTGRWISVRFSFRGKGQFSLSGYTVDWEHCGWH